MTLRSYAQTSRMEKTPRIRVFQEQTKNPENLAPRNWKARKCEHLKDPFQKGHKIVTILLIQASSFTAGITCTCDFIHKLNTSSLHVTLLNLTQVLVIVFINSTEVLVILFINSTHVLVYITSTCDSIWWFYVILSRCLWFYRILSRYFIWTKSRWIHPSSTYDRQCRENIEFPKDVGGLGS